MSRRLSEMVPRILDAVSCVATFLCVRLWVHESPSAVTIGFLAKWAGLLLLVALGVAMSTLIYTSVTVTDSGIRYRRLFSTPHYVRWSDIGGLRRPAHRIPEDAAYVMLRNGKRLQVLRSMRGYAQLVSIIQEKIPGQSDDVGVEERSLTDMMSWGTIWWAIGVGVVVMLLRRLLLASCKGVDSPR